MEHTILASVTSILIGFVVMDNASNETTVRRYLRDGKFTGMVTTLMQYYEFLNLTVSVSSNEVSFNLNHHFKPSLNSLKHRRWRS